MPGQDQSIKYPAEPGMSSDFSDIDAAERGTSNFPVSISSDYDSDW